MFQTRWHRQCQFDVDVSDLTFPFFNFSSLRMSTFPAWGCWHSSSTMSMTQTQPCQRVQLDRIDVTISTIAMFPTRPWQHFRFDHVDIIVWTLSIFLTGPCRHFQIDHVNVSNSKMSTFPTRPWRRFPDRPCTSYTNEKLFVTIRWKVVYINIDSRSVS